MIPPVTPRRRPRTLYLLRHAKSSWADPSLADRDRPLSPRGRRNAAVLASRLARAPIAPELVLCSPALRTRETLAVIGEALPRAAEIRFEERLYGAGADELVALLAELPGTVGAVLLIGHNPGLEDLAGLLDPNAAHEPLPTAALLTVELDGPFAGVAAGRARLVDRVVPR
jgi:phosphohistidine phosphatase